MVINYESNFELAGAVVAEIEAAGGHALAHQADVREVAGVRAMVDATLDRFGRIDVLVNNAGTLVMGKALAMTEQSLHEANRINVVGMLNGAQAVAETMRAQKHGRIINVATTAALGTTATGVAPHVAAKAAVVALTKQLAMELGSFNVSVNVVCPGAIDTEATLPGGALHEMLKPARKRQVENTLLTRAGTVDDVAALIAFLASDEAGFITGQAISVDGGRTDFLTHSA